MSGGKWCQFILIDALPFVKHPPSHGATTSRERRRLGYHVKENGVHKENGVSSL